MFFVTAYDNAHSADIDNPFYVVRRDALAKMYSRLLDTIYGLHDTPKHVYSPLEVRDLEIEANYAVNRAVWLFYKEMPDTFENDFQELIIRLDDVSLVEKDYMVLLHASYNDENTKDILSTFPLAMLHEMYEPAIEASINTWLEDAKCSFEANKGLKV
jgi:hypothetical protein